ncbi:MBL fold metallo-hydrolase [Opitutus sp. ER46]|uniref:MBL fold metallo-hydrolase n=1 Tax=Opitutus sp. ER46 TaxID=2161864 RepID=UPI000D321C34|nr:MBL fold metallo-hydrolase [Opitutus sp. ER46]PTX90973.1 MBL fold metallo-hydrolase [Opitutus sp. ER46]
MIDAIRAFEGGSCRQLLAMVDRRTWRLERFPAVFFALHHTREGWVLVDTGYGGRFHAATRRFPARLYRWSTPVQEAGSAAAALTAAGIPAGEVRHLIVTHFHADHVGGLAEFPQATIHHHEEALRPLRALPAWRQVRAAFLADPVPDWLPERARLVPARAFEGRASASATFDLFGDGSVGLVHLPGHAPGQLGISFALGGRRLLYAADAYWRACQITDGVEPLPVAMALQWDRRAYRQTVGRLRALHARGEYELHACHDVGVAARLNQLSPMR